MNDNDNLYWKKNHVKMRQHVKSQKSYYKAVKKSFSFKDEGSRAIQTVSYNIENTSKRHSNIS